MKRICRRCWWVLIVLMLTPSVLSASEGTGSLSVFAFSEGRPLANIEIVIDGKSAYRTDSDGSRKIILTVGRHQVQVVGKSEDGQNLGYVKSPVEIKNGRDTLFAARFVSDDDDLIMIDTPLEGRETVKKKTFKKERPICTGRSSPARQTGRFEMPGFLSRALRWMPAPTKTAILWLRYRPISP